MSYSHLLCIELLKPVVASAQLLNHSWLKILQVWFPWDCQSCIWQQTHADAARPE